MKLLPLDFLIRIARDYDLSEEQEEAFVMLYSTDKKPYEVAERLGLAYSALRTRMSGAYFKFGFKGAGPNKKRRLHDFLLRRLREAQPEMRDRFPISDIDGLVEEVRERVRADIRERCGSIKIPDVAQPIALEAIYTEVNVLEQRAARQRKGLGDLQASAFEEGSPNRSGSGKIKEERLPGLKAASQHRKLMVVGKPGAGKTTFLKYLAVQCIDGKFQKHCVPVFVTLKNFSEAPGDISLQGYIERQLAELKIDIACGQQLLDGMRVLLLLDGTG